MILIKKMLLIYFYASNILINLILNFEVGIEIIGSLVLVLDFLGFGFDILGSWSIEVKGHGDWIDAVSWSALVDSVVSISTWSISFWLLESWFEQLIDPELRWVHTRLTTVVENVVDRVVLFEWLCARMAAWSGWVCSDSRIAEEGLVEITLHGEELRVSLDHSKGGKI